MERTPSNPSEPSSSCEECGVNPWKYRCPGCSIRSCSLPCVNSHKKRSGCTGKRDAFTSQVVPISQFNDDLIISDYKLLEEVKRLAESSRRMRDEAGGNSVFKLPRRLRMLRNAARGRRTFLLFMARGMSKREKNQSRYSEREKSIFWTIEWRFHSADVVLIDHSIGESVSLSTVIEKHLTPSPWNNQLRPYRDVQLDDLKLFLPKNPKGAKSPFRQLNIKAPIREQLANTVILEYPVIHVFLPSESYDFEVEKLEELIPKNEEPCVSPGTIPSPKGTYFMEEEVEEGEVVSDYPSSDPRDSNRIPEDVMMTEKSANSDVQMQRAAAEVLKPCSTDERGGYVVEEGNRLLKSGVNLMKPYEDVNFDFEKELRDAYSDLIGEINPDDFLCFDGGLDEDELLRGEELEEGEIPS